MGGGVTFVILVGQSFSGFYGGRTEDAWGWFLPTVLPTLSLIVGVLVSQARLPDVPGRSAGSSGPIFRLAAVLSTVYLLLVAASVVIAALLGDRERTPLDLMQLSNLWLAPLQGLAAACLGFFFHHQKE